MIGLPKVNYQKVKKSGGSLKYSGRNPEDIRHKRH